MVIAKSLDGSLWQPSIEAGAGGIWPLGSRYRSVGPRRPVLEVGPSQRGQPGMRRRKGAPDESSYQYETPAAGRAVRVRRLGQPFRELATGDRQMGF